jgi:hypothetical protein
VTSHSQVRVSEEQFVLPTPALRELRERLVCTRLPPDLGAGWERGVPRDWLRVLLEDWRDFDTEALQRGLDALPQLRVAIDGHPLHILHAEGRGPRPLPLLLTHGWPGSFTRSAHGPSTLSEDTFQLSPSLSYSPASCAKRSVQCDDGA